MAGKRALRTDLNHAALIAGLFSGRLLATGHRQDPALHTGLGKQEVEHEADDERGHRRARHVERLAGDEVERSDGKADDPRDPAGGIEPGSRAGPLLAGEQIVGRDRPADRAERSADDRKHAGGVPGVAGDDQGNGSRRAQAAGDERIDLRQRRLETIGRDERRKTCRRESGDRQQEHKGFRHLWAENRTHQAGGSQHGQVGAGLAEPLGAGHGQQRDAAGENCCQGDPNQAAELDVLGVAVVHAEVATRRAGRGEEADNVGADHRDDVEERESRLNRQLPARGADDFRGGAGLDRGVSVEFGDAANRRDQQDDEDDQRNQGEERGDFGHVLDALQADKRGDDRPDDADRQVGRRPGGLPERAGQEHRREIGVDGQPAELEQTHEEAGHQESASHAVGARSDNIEGQAGLHAEHPRHEIEEEMADERGQHHAEQRHAQPLGQSPAREQAELALGRIDAGADRHVLPEDEPEHDPGIGLGRAAEPGDALLLGHRLRRRDIIG